MWLDMRGAAEAVTVACGRGDCDCVLCRFVEYLGRNVLEGDKQERCRERECDMIGIETHEKGREYLERLQSKIVYYLHTRRREK